VKNSYFGITVNTNSLQFADLVQRRLEWDRRKYFDALRRQADLEAGSYVCSAEWGDLYVSQEVCDHCNRRKIGLSKADARCPIALGARIVRLHLNGYDPVLYRETIITELIKLSERGLQ
jgi:hypothetical protein